MVRKLSFQPSKEEIIEAAKSSGWTHTIHKELDVLKKGNPEVCVVLQNTDRDRYTHAIGASYARTLGLQIDGGTIPLPSGPDQWEPTDEEQT